MKNVTGILFIVVLLVLVFSLILFFSYRIGITGSAVSENYTYTKALCNDSNQCEDYEISCQGGDVLSITPTGFMVQLPENWSDSRENETMNELC